MPGSPCVRLRLATVVLLALGLGCVKRPIDYQREYARTLRPGELTAFPREAGAPVEPPRVLRVRAWVDQDFQAQTPRWRERIGDQVRRANRVLEPQFGRRLELLQVLSWPRPSHPPDLPSALAQLEAVDPGRDAELVIGYVSAVRMPTALSEFLGLALLGGRHVVLRSMVWAQEFDDLERALDLLPPDERNELARERRIHREATILLHEWAHTLGAMHESASASIMADLYHPQAVGFSPLAVRVIEAGLGSSAVRAAVESLPGAPASPPPVVTPREPEPASPPAAATGPLPSNLQPTMPAPSRRSGGRTTAERAPERSLDGLEAHEAALKAGPSVPSRWLVLARAADGLHAPALAERAARRAGAEPGAAFLAADAQRQRREVALPLDGSIPAAREPGYVRAVSRVLDPLAEQDLPQAREALRTLASAFPGSPGLALGRCALAVAEKVATATTACSAAVSGFDEAPHAHLLLGIVYGRAGRWGEARRRFQRALELDGSTGEAWSRLAGAHAKLNDAVAQRELEGRYLARFGFALRPVTD